MKTILTKIGVLVSLIILSFSSFSHYSFAEGGDVNIVTVTEKIPGANCTEKKSSGTNGVETKLYECTVERGFSSVMTVMGKLIKYFTFIAGLFAVLGIVVGGVMYSMGGANDGMKTKSKEFMTQSLLGLIVLLLSGVILNAIAPWVYK